jgi:hypothetical protein
MEFPLCHQCNEGQLLPLSASNERFAPWICSAPNCAYAIRNAVSGDTYYKKGIASIRGKDEGTIEYEF